MRNGWAATMTKLSKAAPETRLITLMFPLNTSGGGPPYPLSETIYHELLDANWEAVSIEEIHPDDRRKTGPKGDEKLGIWKRRL